MNKITMLAAVTCLSVAAMPVYADDAHHPEKTQKAAGAKTAAPAVAKPVMPAGDKVKQAQETMQKLQDKMGEIRSTKDPKVRQKLMHEHMQTMQEGMMQMRGMGGGEQGGMMMGGDMMQMHDMMSMRMDMMQTMMEQMMQREEMREGMPLK